MQPPMHGANLHPTSILQVLACVARPRAFRSESRGFKFGTAVRIQFIHINRRAITVRDMTPAHMGLL